MDTAVTTNPCIEGVLIRPLNQIKDERGIVMHILRADDPWFEGFGEVYASLIKKGAVKAWKYHNEMVQNLTVPVGEIRLVIFDDRQNSPTRGLIQEVQTGADKYGLIRIPTGVWYGFLGLGDSQSDNSIIINCASMPHNSKESKKIPPDSPQIPYWWH